MPPLQQDKDSLITAAKSYQSCYKSIHIEILAVKQDNAWYGLYTAVRLSAEERPEEGRVSFSINDKFVIIRKVVKFEIKKFRKVVESVGETLEAGDRTIMLTGLASSALLVSVFIAHPRLERRLFHYHQRCATYSRFER